MRIAVVFFTVMFYNATVTQLQAEATDATDGGTKKMELETSNLPEALAFDMKMLNGEKVNLAKKYKDKVVLVVNVASRCGLTPQYKELQGLHKKYAEQGLAVVGFPCNQFGRQEPGSSEDIQSFCKKNYGVEFDMFEKIEVNGKDACDLYQYLTKLDTKPQSSGKISWNFEKFLIGRDGKVLARFSPRTKPTDKDLIEQLEAAL